MKSLLTTAVRRPLAVALADYHRATERGYTDAGTYVPVLERGPRLSLVARLIAYQEVRQ